jgi:CheY-like chemotaxis protein
LGAALPIVFGQDDPEAPEAHRRDHSRLSPAGGGDPTEGEAQQPQALVVEDDPAMQMLVAFNLRLEGFDVTTASTGREALERAPEQRFDVILLDVMLPDVGGFEVAEELRAAEPTRDVPLVFLSARASSADLARGRALGSHRLRDEAVRPCPARGTAARGSRRARSGERRRRLEAPFWPRLTPIESHGSRSPRRSRC